MSLQVDHSTCSKPPVDFKIKVLARTGQSRPQRNFCFEVNGRFSTSGIVTLYSISDYFYTYWVAHLLANLGWDGKLAEVAEQVANKIQPNQCRSPVGTHCTVGSVCRKFAAMKPHGNDITE